MTDFDEFVQQMADEEAEAALVEREDFQEKEAA